MSKKIHTQAREKLRKSISKLRGQLKYATSLRTRNTPNSKDDFTSNCIKKTST